MQIPDEAVEAATQAIYFDSLSNGSRHTAVDLKVVSKRQAIVALAAAEPILRAHDKAALEAVCDVPSNAEAFGTAPSTADILRAVRSANE